jgi:hypothetical protein
MVKGKFIPKFGGPSILFSVPCIDCVKRKEIPITNHTTERKHMQTALILYRHFNSILHSFRNSSLYIYIYIYKT